MKAVTINKNENGLYYGSVSYRGDNYYADGFLRWIDAWDALIKLIKEKGNG